MGTSNIITAITAIMYPRHLDRSLIALATTLGADMIEFNIS